jgi:hypothetical protein
MFVDGKLMGMCTSFEIAAELAQEHSARKPHLRIECAEPPSRLRVWNYGYVENTWVEDQRSAAQAPR